MNTLSKLFQVGILLSTFIFSSISQVAMAEDVKANSKAQSQESAWASGGLTYQQSGETIDVTVDVSKVIASWPMLVSDLGVNKVEEKDLKSRPIYYAVGAASVIFTANLFGYLYSQDSVNKLHINGYVIPLDGGKKQLCYTYDFEKSMFQKNMTLNDLANMYNLSTWCNAELDKEDKAKK